MLFQVEDDDDDIQAYKQAELDAKTNRSVY